MLEIPGQVWRRLLQCGAEIQSWGLEVSSPSAGSQIPRGETGPCYPALLCPAKFVSELSWEISLPISTT